MDSSDEDARPTFKNKKEFDLYGVFASYMRNSDSEEETKKPKTISKKHFLNFQR